MLGLGCGNSVAAANFSNKMPKNFIEN